MTLNSTMSFLDRTGSDVKKTVTSFHLPVDGGGIASLAYSLLRYPKVLKCGVQGDDSWDEVQTAVAGVLLNVQAVSFIVYSHCSLSR